MNVTSWIYNWYNARVMLQNYHNWTDWDAKFNKTTKKLDSNFKSKNSQTS